MARSLEQRFPAPALMGIVNVTPDSFSDGGRLTDPDAAAAAALGLVQQGASVIDVGGESTRPGSTGVTVEEELRRVVPVIERIRATSDVVVSVDTSKAEVARRALTAGATFVNDVTALTGDGEMAGVVAAAGADLCLMHMQGTPLTMQDDPRYDDVVGEVGAYLAARVAAARAAGIAPERICVDPGIGFGKTVEHNLALLAGLPRLRAAAGAAVLVGVSRKGFLGRLTGDPDGDRLPATLAAGLAAAHNGAFMLRVHDVRAHAQALAVRRAITEAAAPERAVEIAVDGLAVFAYHGALEAERELGQRFYLDLRLTPSSERACDTDDVRDAVHYGEVAVRVRELAEGGPYALLERLGDVVAATLLAEFPLRRVTVRIRKPAAPVPALLDAVAVTVTRHARR
jgi:dihydropteroate synthase